MPIVLIKLSTNKIMIESFRSELRGLRQHSLQYQLRSRHEIRRKFNVTPTFGGFICNEILKIYV